MVRLLYLLHRSASVATHWVLLRLTPAGRLAAAGIGVTAAFGINTHINMAHQAFGFLAAAAVLALIAGRFTRIPVKMRRHVPRYATVGETLSYRLQAINTGGSPLHDLTVQERTTDPRPDWGQFRIPAPGEGTRSFMERWTGFYRWRRLVRQNRQAAAAPAPMPPLAPYAENDIVLQVVPAKRGRLDLPGPMVRRPEPLGLFQTLMASDQYEAVLVLPKLYRLPPSALPGRRQHQPGGVTLAASVGDSEEFVSLRDYRPGDPRRSIHWKSWAKTGKPIVKETQEEYFVRHALVLDTFAANGSADVFEEAVSLAASIVSVRSSETLLDLMFVGPQAYCFTSGRGLARAGKMLEILAGVSICSDKPFHRLTPLVLGRAGLLSACICVLQAWDAHRQSLVETLCQLDIPVTVFVIVAAGDPANLPPGPMKGAPHRFHVLEAGRMQEMLEAL